MVEGAVAEQPGNTLVDEPKRVRTVREIDFFISLEDCPHCGQRVDPWPLRYVHQGIGATKYGPCPKCAGALWFAFNTYGDPRQGASDWDTLGTGPSEIIPPRKFIGEILRVDPRVRPDPSALGLIEWRTSRDHLNRVWTCLRELAKFLPAGADEIPAETSEETTYRDQHRERYSRAWIERMTAEYQHISDATIADLPRINALEEWVKVNAPKGSVEYLEREALAAHKRWIEAGRRGRGRLILFQARHAGLKVPRGAELSAAKLLECDLTNVYLADAKLTGSEIRATKLDHADLYAANLRTAQLNGSSLTYANLERAELDGATAKDSAFTGAALDQTSWKGAVVIGSNLVDAQFLSATLDGGTFRNCDLRGATLAPHQRDVPPTSKGVRFVNCDLRNTNWKGRDLRGAEFVGCKLAGSSGTPTAVDGIEIQQPDMSDAGDGSNIASVADVLAMWGVAAPTAS